MSCVWGAAFFFLFHISLACHTFVCAMHGGFFFLVFGQLSVAYLFVARIYGLAVIVSRYVLFGSFFWLAGRVSQHVFGGLVSVRSAPIYCLPAWLAVCGVSPELVVGRACFVWGGGLFFFVCVLPEFFVFSVRVPSFLSLPVCSAHGGWWVWVGRVGVYALVSLGWVSPYVVRLFVCRSLWLFLLCLRSIRLGMGAAFVLFFLCLRVRVFVFFAVIFIAWMFFFCGVGWLYVLLYLCLVWLVGSVSSLLFFFAEPWLGGRGLLCVALFFLSFFVGCLCLFLLSVWRMSLSPCLFVGGAIGFFSGCLF
ncbi:hypothetical protein CCL15_24200 [Pseudomonas syringae]|nr:hypothetical protein CCL15_24200 [Pseudomonas syringae]